MALILLVSSTLGLVISCTKWTDHDPQTFLVENRVQLNRVVDLVYSQNRLDHVTQSDRTYLPFGISEVVELRYYIKSTSEATHSLYSIIIPYSKRDMVVDYLETSIDSISTGPDLSLREYLMREKLTDTILVELIGFLRLHGIHGVGHAFANENDVEIAFGPTKGLLYCKDSESGKRSCDHWGYLSIKELDSPWYIFEKPDIF